MIKKWIHQKIQHVKDMKNTDKKGLLHRAVKQYPSVWQLNRESIARGIAIGLFVAMIPILPFQTLLVIFLSILLHANLPVAFTVSWISNPVTILPLAYLASRIGNYVLGIQTKDLVIHNFNLSMSNLHDYWSSFCTWISQFGKGFFVGLPILALSVALSGYFLVLFCWRVNDIFKQRKE